MPWKPGESGNPGGRPRGGSIATGQALARERFALAVARLSVIARRGDAQTAVAAIRLMAQIAGVPLTPPATTQPDTQPPAPLTQTPAEMKKELARLLEQ